MRPTTALFAVYGVPFSLTGIPAIPQFIGREEGLASLWAILDPLNLSSRITVVLHALGGIGKTQLAVAFASSLSYGPLLWPEELGRCTSIPFHF